MMSVSHQTIMMNLLLLLTCLAIPCLTQHHQQEPNPHQHPLDEKPTLYAPTAHPKTTEAKQRVVIDTPVTTHEWNLTCANISDAVIYAAVVRDQIDDFKDDYVSNKCISLFRTKCITSNLISQIRYYVVCLSKNV